jgi:hypothetical protein
VEYGLIMLPNSTSIKEFIQLLRDSIVPELPQMRMREEVLSYSFGL